MPLELKTVPNEARCLWSQETHELPLSPTCPVSGNPREGSLLRILYDPKATILEVASLRAFVDSYKGGRGAVRSMEGMVQEITQVCADVLGTYVRVEAELVIDPNQRMILKCAACPERNRD